ncbi:hypothetical protein Ade02nite_49280 [Paractinoplanes deccanensis]|uniref:Winged helix DNA-binding domain-containing protein n=1 Tax=Paractinoplanes deccanensis TaxID=113561 RepID=A0ABQ3Y8H7_9ACTN|nr:winged helix DNA-binding domain-containing protein [Actinoplanes deccanensis]GID76287.1 hypothetical protein Ade02nite_49280 [Actinoplanes deccanensis]
MRVVPARAALAWRLRRHGLAPRPAGGSPAAVAERLCGLHAQVMSSADLSLLARLGDHHPGALPQALWHDRTLVKLWAARGTLHLLPAASLPTWLGALGTLRKFGNNGHPDTERICEAVATALHHRVLTRRELSAEVGRLTGSPRLGSWVASSWGSDLKAASFRGLLCFTDSGFTSPEHWLGPHARPAPAPKSLRSVVRLFLRSYGPTIPGQLTRWWLGPPRDRLGRSLLATVEEETTPVRFAGHEAVVLTADLAELTEADEPSSCRLLPAFDPWVLGMPRAEPFIDPRHLPQVFRPAGRIAPVLLTDGRVTGTWTHHVTSRRTTVELAPFASVSAAVRRAMTTEAERLAAHLGSALELRWHQP